MSTAKSSRSSRSSRAKAASLSIFFAVLGDEPRSIKMPAGSTFADLSAKFGLVGLTSKINGNKATDSTVLADGDTVVAVPQVKGGQ